MRKISPGSYEDTKGTLRLVEAFGEILVLTALYYVFWRYVYGDSLSPMFRYKGKYVLIGVYALLTFLFFENSDCTKFGQLHGTDLAVGQIIALLMVNAITYLQLCLIENRVILLWPMLALTGVQILAVLVLIPILNRIYGKLYPANDTLLVYGSDSAATLKIKMDTRKDMYHVSKVIPARAGLDRICEEIGRHEAVILNDVPTELRNDILRFCYRHRVRTYVAPEIPDILIRGAKDNNLFDTPLVMIRGTGLTPVQRICKRAMDIVLCSIAMIPAAPVMLAVAAAIKIEDRGPVFYRQKRLTRGGREFEILKFRSMIVDAEKYAGAVLAADNDPRITRVGKFIRATRLDEIPQILNILKGDMRIVGPRPERKVFADEFQKEIPEFAYRLKVRGGLTGYAQIYGKYNTTAYDKLRLDMMYIENYSLLLDIKLIILTLRIIFSKESTEGIDKAEEYARQSEALIREAEEMYP